MTKVLYLITAVALLGLLIAIDQPWRDWGPEQEDAPYPKPASVPVATLDPGLDPEIAEIVMRAQAFFDGGQEQAALDLLLPYADHGLMDLDALLGRIYLSDTPDVQNYDSAYRYLLAASKKGHMGATFWLGYEIYRDQVNTSKQDRGRELLELAASCGMPAANYYVSLIILTVAESVEALENGRMHASFAAWAGMPEAQWLSAIYGHEIARVSSDGRGHQFLPDTDTFVWSIVAAENGNDEAKSYVESTLAEHMSVYPYKDFFEEAIRREAAILPANPYLCGFSHPMLP